MGGSAARARCSRSAPLGRFRLGLLVAVAVLAGACGGTSGATSSYLSGQGGSSGTVPVEVRTGGTISYGLNGTVNGFNVNTAAGDRMATQEVMDQVLPQVFVTDPQFQPELNTELVSSAELVSTSPETIVYKINPDAVWSDGVPIGAADFVYAWQAQSGDPAFRDVGGKAYLPASTAGYDDIRSVTGSNGGKTVTVVFARPFGDWRSLFSDLIPAHIGREVGWDNGFSTFNPKVEVSGGPFEITGYTPGSEVVLSRNPHYWGPPAMLDHLVFKLLSGPTADVAALRDGSIQVLYTQPDNLLYYELEAVPGVSQEVAPGMAFEHLDFNERNGFLAMSAVREAIAEGTDRAAITQAAVGNFEPGAQPDGSHLYVGEQPQYQNDGQAYETASPEAARALLEKAGFTMGPEGYYELDGKELELTITSTSGDYTRLVTEELFQEQMQAIGVKIDISNTSKSELFDSLLPSGNFDIALFAWVDTPYVSGDEAIYATRGAMNYDAYSDPKVDALFNQAVAELDPSQAAGIYNQVDQLLWKDMATLPLYQVPDDLASVSGYGNIEENGSNMGPPWNAEEWGIVPSAS